MKKFLPLALFLMVGCQNVPPTVFIREVPVQVTSTNRLDVIRFPAAYKSYTVGRRRDRSNPGMMHEAHVLYIRETPDRWNLHPPSAPSFCAAPAGIQIDPAFVPLPLDGQFRQEFRKQQEISRSLAEQTERIQRTAEQLVPATRKAMEMTAEMKIHQLSIEDRLRRLEETQRPASFTNWPSIGQTNR